MTPLKRLNNLGIHPVLTDGGKIHLDRPGDIIDETWEQAVSLAKQNKAKIVAALKGSCPTRGRSSSRITPFILTAWKTARPWILNHLQELQAKGWTRKQLFQAGRYSFPHGPWGPAWSPNWLRQGVEISIDSDGAVRWTWTEPGGRKASQAAGPRS